MGDGWAATSLDELGDGPGFRKIRSTLGVEAFGINALVLPAGFSTPFHAHERQEETYFVHSGVVEMEFGLEDGERVRLEPGGLARVAASTFRRIHVVGETEAVLVVAGGEGGYVGRDGVQPPDSGS